MTNSAPFVSCLLVVPTQCETRHVVRALHSGDMAVLEREPQASTLNLALTREFSVVAWHVDARSAASIMAIARLAALSIPVIALVDAADPTLVADALAAGADACLDINSDSRVIVAQVRAVLRRCGAYDSSAPEVAGLLQVGDLSVDVDRCEVQRAGTFVALTATEFRIVEYMARHCGRVLKPHDILNATGSSYEYLPREAQDVFKVYVRRIRRKLEPNENEPRYLLTVRGFGYRLEGGRAVPAVRSVATTA
jgi:DNA-binding response OmpR family regulator